MVKDLKYYTEGVRSGNRLIIAKTITLIESAKSEHINIAQEILNELLPFTGNAIRIGITGVPGVGKSTFIESLGIHLIQKKYNIAVLAVDPSSNRSGGSILADKTRMEKLSCENKAFIRPSPSGGTLGGVAKKTRETMLVCEAAGFDVVIVETVGVGQSETTVASMVDFFLVLMLAGAGDELQGIKKGILEIADAVAINKADGDNIQNAEKARQSYEAALHLICSSKTWYPPVITCSALESKGIDTVWDTVLSHRHKLSSISELEEKRKSQAIDWMHTLLEQGLKDRFYNIPEVKSLMPKIIRDVEKGIITPASAANELLCFLDK